MLFLNRDTIIDCTLWDSLSVEFMTSYNERSDSGPIVVIIKHARVKEPQGYSS
jgi:replication factor A1